VKLHTLLHLRGSIPTNVYVTGGQVHDFTQACAFFVTHAKKNMQFYRRYSRPVERSAGLRCDQTMLLTGVRTAKRQ